MDLLFNVKERIRLSSGTLRYSNSCCIVLMIILFYIILRVPRVDGIIGMDAFKVFWMGRVISEGYFGNWIMTPFSLIGCYPFASYPIGGPLIVGPFLFAGVSLETTVFFRSIIIAVLTSIGALKLGKELFDDENSILLFTGFYSLSNVLTRFTYFTLSARGLYLAILPWVILYSIKWLKNRKPSHLIKQLSAVH